MVLVRWLRSRWREATLLSLANNLRQDCLANRVAEDGAVDVRTDGTIVYQATLEELAHPPTDQGSPSTAPLVDWKELAVQVRSGRRREDVLRDLTHRIQRSR